MFSRIASTAVAGTALLALCAGAAVAAPSVGKITALPAESGPSVVASGGTAGQAPIASAPMPRPVRPSAPVALAPNSGPKPGPSNKGGGPTASPSQSIASAIVRRTPVSANVKVKTTVPTSIVGKARPASSNIVFTSGSKGTSPFRPSRSTEA